MKVLRIGDVNTDVCTLQRALNLIPDGHFGQITLEAVKEFQKSKGLVADGIVGAKTWALLDIKKEEPANEVRLPNIKKSKRSINEIIVHCSATPEGRDVTVNDIRKWHIEKGYNTIGYHYVCYNDGTIHIGRDVDMVGAHCEGHNARSIGVCYIGGVAKDGKTAKDTRNMYQKDGLFILLKRLKQIYPNARICGHNKYSNKACPSFDAEKEYSKL